MVRSSRVYDLCKPNPIDKELFQIISNSVDSIIKAFGVAEKPGESEQ